MAEINNSYINFTEYTPNMFVQMMQFLAKMMSNSCPLMRRYNGYVYFFSTETVCNRFDIMIQANVEEALKLPAFAIKEGADSVLSVNVTSGYNNTILLGSTDNYLDFTFETRNGAQTSYEAVTVNYTFQCGKVTQVYQDQYQQHEDVHFKLDDFLLEGLNNITIVVTGNESKVQTTVSVVYNVCRLSVTTDLSIARSYSKGVGIDLNVKTEGVSDNNGDIYVDFFVDGVQVPADTLSVNYQDRGTLIPHRLSPVNTAGVHTLQVRARATISGEIRYSHIEYYEFFVEGALGRYVTIKRTLPDSNLLANQGNFKLYMEQYVQENIEWGYISSNTGESVTVSWSLDGAENQQVGSSDLSDDSASGSDGAVHTLTFLPFTSGEYKLVARIKVANGGIYEQRYAVNVIPNSNGLRETTNQMLCRLSAMGRDNNEDVETVDTWHYGSVTSEFQDFDWSSQRGWYKNALVVSGGAKVIVNVQPFATFATNKGITVEIEYETFNARDVDAVLLNIGERIVIKPNSATFKSSFGTTLTDKYPTNTRQKLAFIAHPSASTASSQPQLMEIINNGVTSRCVNYNSSDTFVSMDKIVIGGTESAGIKVYAIRVYTMDLSNTQELNNVIVDSDDIARLVSSNDIYSNGVVDVNKIRNRIPCLAITGKGGTNVMQTIWDYTSENNRPTIHVDAEWTNPQYPISNWICKSMRVRGHGQSTMRNPRKSLKIWLKNDKDDAQWETQFYPNGIEDTTTDHRWVMKEGAMPGNKFVMQCYYIDSSNCKSPALLSMIDSVMRSAGLLTPPQLYARDKWQSEMNEPFPYRIRQAADSVAGVLISRDDETSDWNFDGIFVLMNDKKDDYLYGERTIYNCPGDPFCFDDAHDKKAYLPLWDNTHVTRFEFKSNNHPISTGKDVSTFYKQPQEFERDDDEVVSDGEGGDASGMSATNYDFEQALEIIYPDYDDFFNKNKEFELDKYHKHVSKLFKFFEWTSKTYALDNGGPKSQAAFQRSAERHMNLDFWAAYYIFAMTNGCFDSLVRNMQLTTFEEKELPAFKYQDGSYVYEEEEGIYSVWLPLWWDIDIQHGTINTGPLAFDPPVDRTTTNREYGIAFRGSECWFWDALEKWPAFINRCTNVLNDLYTAGYTCDALINLQDEYVNCWPEAMYNESQNFKYKNMYLADNSKSAFLSYCLGDGKNFRRWWMKKNFDYWMARLAGGSFVAQGFEFRCNVDGNGSFTVEYGDDTFFGWIKGKDKQATASGTYSMQVSYGESITTNVSSLTNSDTVTILSAPYLRKLDISSFGAIIGQVYLDNCVDATTGTMLEELRFGIASPVANGTRNGSDVSIRAIDKLSSMITLQAQGFTGIQSLVLSGCISLENLYCKGSAFQSIELPSAVNLKVAELPASLAALKMDSITLGALRFYDPTTLAVSTFPQAMRSATFLSMGSSSVVKTLVLDWIKYCRDNNLLSQCSLTLTQIAWTACSYEDVCLLGLIPRANRNYSGKVSINRTLTTAEMNNLVELFNDAEKNVNVFSMSSTFKIDCAAGFILTGPSTILAGNVGQIVAAVFPLTTTGYLYDYKITKIMRGGQSLSTATLGDGNSGSQMYANVVLDCFTGEISTIEDPTPTTTYTITATARSESGTTTGTIDVTVQKRTYPTKVEVQGKDVVEANGTFGYNLVTTPPEIDGTQVTGTWSLTGGNEDITLKDKTYTGVNLEVRNFVEDMELKLTLDAKWKDNSEFHVIKNISLIFGADEAIWYYTTNHIFYTIISNGFKECTGQSPSSMEYFRRAELRLFKTLPDLTYKTTLTDVKELNFFRNVTEINLSGDTQLNHKYYQGTAIDLTLSSQLVKITLPNADALLPYSVKEVYMAGPSYLGIRENMQIINISTMRNIVFFEASDKLNPASVTVAAPSVNKKITDHSPLHVLTTLLENRWDLEESYASNPSTTVPNTWKL